MGKMKMMNEAKVEKKKPEVKKKENSFQGETTIKFTIVTGINLT